MGTDDTLGEVWGDKLAVLLFRRLTRIRWRVDTLHQPMEATMAKTTKDFDALPSFRADF